MGNIYVADKQNHRVQVLDKNGSFIHKFGTQGTAPGEFSSPSDLDFLSDGTLIVADQSYLNYFQSDGSFIKRVNANNAKISVSVAYDDTIFSYGIFRDRDGNQIVNPNFAQYNAYMRPNRVGLGGWRSAREMLRRSLATSKI